MSQQRAAKLASMFQLEFPQSVGVFGSYEDAQKAVDLLADAAFPVQNLAIVGTELKSVERVTGRRTWGTVIGQGVQSGLSTALLVTLLMWVLQPSTNLLLLMMAALVIGVLIGVAFSALSYWTSHGRRDFTSISQTVATRYELLSEHKVAAQARELLAGLPGLRAAQFDPRLAPPPFPPAAGFPPASFSPGQYPPGPYLQAGPYPYPGAFPPPQFPPGYPPVPPSGTGYPATPSGAGFAAGAPGSGLGDPPDSNPPDGGSPGFAPSVPSGQDGPQQD